MTAPVPQVGEIHRSGKNPANTVRISQVHVVYEVVTNNDGDRMQPTPNVITQAPYEAFVAEFSLDTPGPPRPIPGPPGG